jgi:SAM-dependent methyltransferase
VEVQNTGVGADEHHAESAEIQNHRRQSIALWQQLAGRWEQGRHTLGAPTRCVSEWLVGKLAPEPGQTILDLAAGTGEAGFFAATHLGDRGRLICSDFAPQMVSAAERVARELAVNNAEFRVLDAEQLALPDASVDGVICRFGYMLMGDPGRALRETRRVLRPGGRLAFCVWGEPQRNPWMTVPTNVMIEQGHMQRRDPDGPGMFRMRDSTRIGPLLREAGFSGCVIEEMAVSHRFENADALWAFTSELQGPIALAIDALGDHDRQAVRSMIETRAAPFRAGIGYEFPGSVVNVLAG